jgi:hypothetical protein
MNPECVFKKGDKVQRINGGEIFEVEKVGRPCGPGWEVWFTKGTWLCCADLVLLPKFPNPPHKHAELIKAWADGAEIEIQQYDGSWGTSTHPQWTEERKYRIKPQKSEKELKIEELEKQARDLADQIAKLKES